MKEKCCAYDRKRICNSDCVAYSIESEYLHEVGMGMGPAHIVSNGFCKRGKFYI